MIVWSAHHLAARMQAGAHQTVLAGIGASSLAAWLANDILLQAGIDAPLLSEIGIYSYVPQP